MFYTRGEPVYPDEYHPDPNPTFEQKNGSGYVRIISADQDYYLQGIGTCGHWGSAVTPPTFAHS